MLKMKIILFMSVFLMMILLVMTTSSQISEEPKEKPNLHIELSSICTPSTKDIRYSDNINTMIISAGNEYADSQCLSKYEAPSLKYAEFSYAYPISIQHTEEKCDEKTCVNVTVDGADPKYPLTIDDIIDYNTTSMKLSAKLAESELNKDIPITVYSKEQVFNEEKQQYEEKNIVQYSDTINLKSTDEKAELTLPFGFGKEVHIGESSSTIIYSITSGTGSIWNSANTWSDAHSDTVGDQVYKTNFVVGSGSVQISGFNYPSLWRGFFPLNKSSISGQAISNVTFCVYVSVANDVDNDGDDFLVVVGNTTQATIEDLTTNDIEECGAVTNPYEYSNRIDITDGISTGTYNCFQITEEGINLIENNDIIKFGLREGHDVLNNAPTTTANERDAVTISTTYDAFYNITFLEYGLAITSPTTSSPASVSPSDKLTVRFNLTENNVPLTTGVTQENVTIGGVIAPPVKNLECTGTPDACSTYTTEASCNLNGTGCSWSSTEWVFVGMVNESVPVVTAEQINLPAGTTTDDIVIVAAAQDYNTRDCVINTAGYTNLYDSGDGNPVSLLSYKIMGETPDVNVEVEALDAGSFDRPCAVVIQVWRGVNTNAPLSGSLTSTGNGASGMPNSPSITPTDNGALVFTVGFLDDDDVTATAPAGFGNLSSSNTGQGGGSTGASVMMASFIQTTAGASDAAAFGGGGTDQWDAVAFALNSSGSGCSGTVNSCSLSNYPNSTSCLGAGCTYGFFNEYGITDIGWEVNVTVPAGCSGLSDLFVNATYSSNTYNETQANAVNCGGADPCSCPDSGNFEISDGLICNITTACDIGNNRFRVNANNGVQIYANIRAGGCYIDNNVLTYYVDNTGGLFCGG